MALTIKLRQGTNTQLTGLTTGMVQGEPLYVTDSKALWVADSSTTKFPMVVDLSGLSEVTDSNSVDGDDLLYLYLKDGAGVRARAIKKSTFKASLNIPEASTDEKVAVADGAVAGYLGDGSDGVIRVGVGLKATVGSASAFITYRLGFTNEAQGDLIYRGASDWARLPHGVQGYLLQTNGENANPSWIGVIDGGVFAG